MNKVKFWTVAVRFENGDGCVFNFDHDPRMITGDPAKTAGSSIARS